MGVEEALGISCLPVVRVQICVLRALFVLLIKKKLVFSQRHTPKTQNNVPSEIISYPTEPADGRGRLSKELRIALILYKQSQGNQFK